MFVFANSVVFILFSEFIMSWIIMSQKDIMIKDMINSENSEKHDVTIILKLQRATRLQLAAPYKCYTIIVMSFSGSKYRT